VRATEDKPLSCVPGGHRTSWESCAADEWIRVLSLGHFPTELVRGFVRINGDELPTAHDVRMSGGAQTPLEY